MFLPECMYMYCVWLVPERSEREAESLGTGVVISVGAGNQTSANHWAISPVPFLNFDGE